MKKIKIFVHEINYNFHIHNFGNVYFFRSRKGDSKDAQIKNMKKAKS